MPRCCRPVLASFIQKLLRWQGLRADRPNVVTIEDRCGGCGRRWLFRATVEEIGSGPYKAIDPP